MMQNFSHFLLSVINLINAEMLNDPMIDSQGDDDDERRDSDNYIYYHYYAGNDEYDYQYDVDDDNFHLN